MSKHVLILILVATCKCIFEARAVALENQPGSAGVATWSYDVTSALGPQFWDALARDSDGEIGFPGCRISARPQSPLSLQEVAVDPSLRSIDFSGYATPGSTATPTNDGRMLRLVPSGTLVTAAFEGRSWDLAVAEFHTPAEHAFGGSVHDMELHLVHRAKDDPASWLIIAVSWVAASRGSHATLQKLAQNQPLPSRPQNMTNASRSGAVSLRWSSFLPTSRAYYRYTGTWSYPPCTAATIVVLATPLVLSVAQLDTIINAQLGGALAPVTNARPYSDALATQRVRKYIEGAELLSAPVCPSSDAEGVSVGRINLGVAICAVVLAGLCLLGLTAVLAIGASPKPSPSANTPSENKSEL
jgi:carbonic anhydrase